MRATLGQRNFALLWLGGLISFTGDWMLRVALPYYIYQQTGSTLATATLAVAELLPAVLLGSVAGVFVDRWRLKRILIVANLLQMLVVLVLMLVRSSDWIWVVYVVALGQSALTAFTQPAESALLPRLVDAEHLLAANTLNNLNNTIARLIGPPIGGVLLAFFGLSAVVICDGVSFALAAMLIGAVRFDGISHAAEQVAEQAATAAHGMAAFAGEWLEGLKLIRRDRLILGLMIILGVMTLGGTMFDPLTAPFVRDVLREDAAWFGWLLTAQATGGLCGGLIIGSISKRFSARTLLAWGNIMVGMLLLLRFNVPWLPLALGTAIIIGPEQLVVGASLDTLLQRSVADRFKGRVFGTMGAIGALLSMLGAGLGGILGKQIGIVPALNVAVALTLVSGVLALLLLPRGVRRAGESGQAMV